MKKNHDFISLYDRFIKESINGKRSKKNGDRIGKGTISNYAFTRKLLNEFRQKKSFELKLIELKSRNQRDWRISKQYWKKFYSRFRDFLLYDKGYFDNYASLHFKNIRVFFNWLRLEKGLNIGEFHKLFYIRNETLPVISLSEQRLRFLIFDKSFEQSLSKSLCKVKDMFVFGCTVGLRYSDLCHLTTDNLSYFESSVYLLAKAKKTGIRTRIRLPGYAIEILKRRIPKRKKLFRSLSLSRFNINLKKIAQKASWNEEINKFRDKQGTPIKINNSEALRFCDIISSHIMRRTAVTYLLSSGVPELFVRKITGHTADSKSFYRYIEYVEQQIDQATDLAFAKLTDPNAEKEI